MAHDTLPHPPLHSTLLIAQTAALHSDAFILSDVGTTPATIVIFKKNLVIAGRDGRDTAHMTAEGRISTKTGVTFSPLPVAVDATNAPKAFVRMPRFPQKQSKR